MQFLENRTGTEQEPESLEDIHSRLRQGICPAKKLTFDTLGQNSDKLIPTAQLSSQALASFTKPFVEDDLDPPSDTTGWATNLLLACHKINKASPNDEYNFLLEDPSLGQLLAVATSNLLDD